MYLGRHINGSRITLAGSISIIFLISFFLNLVKLHFQFLRMFLFILRFWSRFIFLCLGRFLIFIVLFWALIHILLWKTHILRLKLIIFNWTLKLLLFTTAASILLNQLLIIITVRGLFRSMISWPWFFLLFILLFVFFGFFRRGNILNFFNYWNIIIVIFKHSCSALLIIVHNHIAGLWFFLLVVIHHYDLLYF